MPRQHSPRALCAKSTIAAFTFAALLPIGVGAEDPPIGVMVTGWGPVLGLSREYSDYVVVRSVVGDKTNYPDEPCTQWHVGDFPFASEKGLLPFVVSYKTEGFEKLWDSFGIWRLSDDGASYVSAFDPALTMSVGSIGDAKVTALKDTAEADVSVNREAPLAVDPRDGTDHLAGLYRIDLPNGLHDVQEMSLARWTRINGMMGFDETDPVIQEPAGKAIEDYVSRYIAQHYGNRVDLRFGYYAPVAGLTRSIEDVAVSFANDGISKLLIARETTDHNTYANTFWDLFHTLKGLCKAGVPDGTLAIEQVRQVGRTPEYNTMVAYGLKRHFDLVAPGGDVALVYTTYGLPWPGGNPKAGPFSAPQPFIQEVYHENAFLNFLSFKPYALAQYGRDYDIDWTPPGIDPASTVRTENYYAYGMTEAARIRFDGDPDGFRTLREVIEQAVREDGHREVILALSHWYDNSQNILFDLRFLNQIPLNTIAEMDAGTQWQVWCERYTGPGAFEQVAARDRTCPDGYARLQVTEAFDDIIDMFSLGYAQRIRGGIERFGVFPNLDIKVSARGAVTKAGGGTVAVNDGPLAGARLAVPADPRPGAPDGYAWDKVWRPAGEKFAYNGPDAIHPINAYTDSDDYLDAAKDDFDAFIGTQSDALPGRRLPVPGNAISPVVLFGPYRTLFDAPARITLPIDLNAMTDPSKVMPVIYNDLTGAYDPVYPIAGSSGVSVDESAGTVSFDVQTLGNFAAVNGTP
ncbi:MAG: hypothetical protein KDE14_00275 [Rhodobacteraceae bacterium]|nr:hypothetical protein [Paracoccaceae bacterium]